MGMARLALMILIYSWERAAPMVPFLRLLVLVRILTTGLPVPNRMT